MARRDKNGQVPGTYEVGYARPPESHRFKPGQSGNPKGRPKGTGDLLTHVTEELKRKVTISEGGRTRKVEKGKAVAMRVVDKGMKGEDQAIRTLAMLNRVQSAKTQSVMIEEPEDEADTAISPSDQEILDHYFHQRSKAAEQIPAAPDSASDEDTE